MLIWKNNTSNLRAFTFPKSFLLEPDDTCKTNALLFTEGLTLVGADYSSYLDFDPPIVKSYIVSDVTDVGVLYRVGTTVTLEEAKLTERLDIAILDSSDNFLVSPNPQVKLYINLWDASETISAPFGYLMSSMLEFCHAGKQLYSLYLKNNTGSPIKAIVQVSKHNYEDTNYEPPVVIQVAKS